MIYLNSKLGYSEDTATVIFHIFSMSAYFMCIVGAILSDVWWGKFKTISRVSILYVLGSILVSVSAIPKFKVIQKGSLFLGLALVAVGSGGIKPCVSAFGGDQFKLPGQAAQLATFFSIFYFTINVGSLMSTALTPILRQNVHCLEEDDCYPLAFGVPAILMIIAIGKCHFYTAQETVTF